HSSTGNHPVYQAFFSLTFNIEGLSVLNLKWAHLTTVKITIRDPDAFLHLRRLCPNLSFLTADTAFSHARTLEPLTHANIQSLSIACWQTSLTGLFNALSLPTLRVLEARRVHSLSWLHKQLQAFLARSGCPLRILILTTMVTVTDAERAECVALLPLST
ncbi:hypothetical protein EDB19DRAFT_1760424, partial [Suillus lakei]